MPSALSWLAHDATEDARLRKVLALLKQKEARDELGIGAVRDSLADHLFPGTSTIQTRLRYFLIVPWVYRHLEDTGVPAARFGADGRTLECDLIAPLLANEDNAGVFGRISGRTLERLPSEIYWAGLGSWGIRSLEISRGEYHRAIDRLRARRTERRTQSGDRVVDPTAWLWHRRLPEAPDGFPERLGFEVTGAEARFLHDRIVEQQPGSLLEWLVRQGTPADLNASAPWGLRARADLPAPLAERLEHARAFSEVYRGAPILYNLMLAELAEPDDERAANIRAARAVDLERWAASLGAFDLDRWSLDRFWDVAHHPHHNISARTKTFVRLWVQHARSGRDLSTDEDARALIRRRETALKRSRGRSRFHSPALRERWSGTAGMVQLTYRWSQAKTLLADLYAGLNR